MNYSESSLRGNSKIQSGPDIMNIVTSKEGCKTDSCAKSAVITLAGQELCLDHFLASCYERLDVLEPMIRGRSLDATEVQSVRAILEECSNTTLRVCLRQEHLTNLDRSRLLEILLLCGDLLPLLSRLRLYLGASVAHVPDVFSHNSRERKGEESQRKNRPAEEA